MPAKNVRKKYVSGGYYHLYNRGVEKREIFRDRQDFQVLLSYLKEYLQPKNQEALLQQLADASLDYEEKEIILRKLNLCNFSDSLSLLCYTLKPNHFHFQVKQTLPETIDHFLNALGTRYVMYFNKKYKRVGPLFQGNYKAVLVESEEQLLQLSRYIHAQSLNKTPEGNILEESPSSYPNYLGKVKQDWVKTGDILSYFKALKRTADHDILSYQSFVEDYKYPDQLEIPSNLLLEEDGD